ncbi:DNA-binding response regulator [Actinoplanes cyaneus]|uniref:DNA-binding response regulator n=1 Tax=Actinoplanes cyaneus TaxID=52696 RepID=A0A919ISK5_9ACTN|nr:LuxR C-terminal-related transcriptional regulator [Actinoplanes cyaneus]MCW2138219.1 DNA-binding response regulator, NarL/FixJ family, contains REC and HTH domains [Actinoplanes cyaneus]GID70486.1 DNA-binding response regulator [Actinoplanes cyaneus]
MPEQLNVGVLCRNEVLCRGLVAVLESADAIGTVHPYADEVAASHARATGRHDVLIVAAADAGWLEAVDAQFVAGRTRVLVLVDAAAARDLSVYAALAVDGFLAQDGLSAATLLDALQRCCDGGFPMPSGLARALLARADAPHHPVRGRPTHLTSRETEALTLLVKGMSNKQIARRLAISSHGAKRLVASIMLKLNSPNRTTAAINAIKAGLVEH